MLQTGFSVCFVVVVVLLFTQMYDCLVLSREVGLVLISYVNKSQLA